MCIMSFVGSKPTWEQGRKNTVMTSFVGLERLHASILIVISCLTERKTWVGIVRSFMLCGYVWENGESGDGVPSCIYKSFEEYRAEDELVAGPNEKITKSVRLPFNRKSTFPKIVGLLLNM